MNLMDPSLSAFQVYHVYVGPLAARNGGQHGWWHGLSQSENRFLSQLISLK
jgi:hypothetical protein